MTVPPPPGPLKKLTDFLSRLPGHRRNARLHPSTLIRWVSPGVRLSDGTRLRLAAVRAGARWLTCDQWFDEFLDRLTAAHTPAPGPPVARAAPSRAATRACRELDRLGL